LKRLFLLFALLFSSCAPLSDPIQAALAQAQFTSAKYADCRSNFEGIDQDPKSYYGGTVCFVGLIAYKYKTRDPSSGASLVIARLSYMQPGLELISTAVDVFPGERCFPTNPLHLSIQPSMFTPAGTRNWQG